MSSKFDELTTSVLLQPTLSREQVVIDAKSFEERIKNREDNDRTQANIAKAYFVKHGDNIDYKSKYENLLKSTKGSPVRRKDHDIEKHPFDPTEFEKTLECRTCGIRGHATRTCKKKKNVTADEDNEDDINAAYAHFTRVFPKNTWDDRHGSGYSSDSSGYPAQDYSSEGTPN